MSDEIALGGTAPFPLAQANGSTMPRAPEWRSGVGPHGPAVIRPGSDQALLIGKCVNRESGAAFASSVGRFAAAINYRLAASLAVVPDRDMLPRLFGKPPGTLA